MIRRAKAGDMTEIIMIEEICFTVPWSQRILREGMLCPYDVYIVSEVNGMIVGYGVLRTIFDESEVQRIAVLPAHMRKGYARNLLEYMVHTSIEKGAKNVVLEVRSSNQAARNLYKTYGFLEEGFRKEYYSRPTEDALLMRLVLG